MSHYDQAREVFARQIEALQATLEALAEDFEHCVELLLGISGHVIVSGVGKSGIIAHKIAATFASTGTPSLFINASEALHGDLGMVRRGDAAVLVSASAATPELVKMLPSLERIGATVIGICGRRDTPLARSCSVVLDASVAREACPLNLAPMSSTTVALVIGDALAAALMTARGFTAEQFATFHPGGSIGRRLLLRAVDVMHSGVRLPVIGEATPFRELLVEMTRPNLGAVCVTDSDGRLTGIVTDGDVRRSLLESGDLNRRASDIMTARPVTARPCDRLVELLECLETRCIDVLPAADDNAPLVGLLRMHDILAGS